jgi:hypothetical protein
MAYTEKRLPIPVPNEESGAEEEVRKNPQPTKEQVGRGFGADVTKPSADDAEFMATKVTPNPVSVSSEKTINYESNKPKVVTKEQMKAAGFDNLRDYLNDKQGLKRRGDSASPSTSSNPLDLEKGNSRGQKAPMAMAVKTTMGQGKKPYDPGSVDNSFAGSKFAKGGVTRSSASKRADGCATKGFTKGRNL